LKLGSGSESICARNLPDGPVRWGDHHNLAQEADTMSRIGLSNWGGAAVFALLASAGFAAEPQADFDSATHEPLATTLSPPVSITYTGTSPALNITDDGTSTAGNAPAINVKETGLNRGINVSVTNTTNEYSAVYGTTAGTGSGVVGVTTGIGGYGGKFQINNENSAQPALEGLTNGTGAAVYGLLQNARAGTGVYGNASSSSVEGVGVEGLGGYWGVYGTTASGGTGVHGESTATFAQDDEGFGVAGYSGSVSGVYGYNSGTAGNCGGCPLAGVWGNSINGYGVYGQSSKSYAGYFAGKVAATSFQVISDRNVKTDFEPVNGQELLDRVEALPISSWAFKNDEQKLRHVGPTAQDFHDAFQLNGEDDTHINLTDIAGVSLAAIKQLNTELKRKDAEIAELKAQYASQSQLAESLAARMNALEQQVGAAARTGSTIR